MTDQPAALGFAMADRFDGGVAVHPPLDQAALGGIPAKRGVFLLLAEGARPILLTTAADIRSRLRFRLTDPADGQRHKSADLRQITAAVYWKLAPSPFHTDWQFLELARAIWPDRYTELVSYKPPWFVTVDGADAFPQFVRTREFGGRGMQFGPFPDQSSAEQFIELLSDAFDLCRDYGVLRQAPRGVPCSYRQMGRCAGPCDGSISLEEYRRLILRAAEFAGGCREPRLRELTDQMRQAAAETRFEQAAVLKGRIERLREFDAAKFTHVRQGSALRWVIIQSGPGTRKACAMVCDRGAIASAGLVDWPLQDAQLQAVLNACDALAASHSDVTAADRLGLGLVVRYLFTDPAKAGLFLPRDQVPDAAALRAAIEPAAQRLGLRTPAAK